MSMHPARQAYVEEENGGDDQMEGIDYASVRTSTQPVHCLPVRSRKNVS